MSVVITLTTINVPKVVESYIANFQKYDHKEVEFVIVGDLKTPESVHGYCSELSKKHGFPIHYLDVKMQEEILRPYPHLSGHLPYNSFARRNIGDLWAYTKDFSTIIRIDDDNYIHDDDFISFHSIVGNRREIATISSNNGWFNICEQLQDGDGIPFYPRGFPYSQRWQPSEVTTQKRTAQVVLNAGLWLGNPDVDAITRLCKPINATGYKEQHGSCFGLAKGTWCPVNTQNTAYAREIMPASFVPPNVGRYDDIWSGYMLRKIMDHLGDTVTFGRPLLYQDRNAHDLWKDLQHEMNGNLYTDHFLHCLRNIQLKKSTYADCYYELAEELQKCITQNVEVFSQVIAGMKIWVDALA